MTEQTANGLKRRGLSQDEIATLAEYERRQIEKYRAAGLLPSK